MMNLTEKFSFNFIISNLAPSLFYAGLSVIIFNNFACKNFQIFSQVYEIENLGITSVLLGAFILSIALSSLNTTIIKLFEGLIGRKWFPLWRFLEKRQRKNFRDLIKKIKDAEDASGESFRLQMYLMRNFPTSENDVLPTRLGNTLAAFEHYPYRRYNIDAITLWPRLFAVIPEHYRILIENARSQFSFLVNMVIVISAFGLECLFCFSLYKNYDMAYLASVSFASAFLFYRFSFAAAASWGETVKASFDLYRFKLLEQLNIEMPQKSFSTAEEKEIWKHIQWSMKYLYDPGENIKFIIKEKDKNNDSD